MIEQTIKLHSISKGRAGVACDGRHIGSVERGDLVRQEIINDRFGSHAEIRSTTVWYVVPISAESYGHDSDRHTFGHAPTRAEAVARLVDRR